MKDRTRRSLAVLLFLVFGPTVTVALIGWIVLRRSPLAVQFETNSICTATGIDLKIDSVEYLRWNLWKYGQVELPHPNTGQPFVVFSDLENRLLQPKVSWLGTLFSPLLPGKSTDSFRRINSPSVSIALKSQTDIAVLSHLLLNQFGDRFADRTTGLAFIFNEFELIRQEDRLKMTLVEGRFRSEDGRCSLECKFNLHENSTQEPILFRITRQRNNSPEEPELLVELRTDMTEVPVRFLAIFFPGLASLGPEAFFHGNVLGEFSKKKWTVKFDDMTIFNADLKTLGAELTPYRLSGQLQIGITLARMEFIGNQSRFLDADGYMSIIDGSIERTLLARLVDDWQLSPTPNHETNPMYQNTNLLSVLSQERQEIPFAEVLFSVFLGRDGVSIRPMKQHGLIIEMDKLGHYKYHLPKQVGAHPIPYSDILNSFSPNTAEVLRITPQIQRILPHLYLP